MSQAWVVVRTYDGHIMGVEAVCLTSADAITFRETLYKGWDEDDYHRGLEYSIIETTIFQEINKNREHG
jgi:hypothetical protein